MQSQPAPIQPLVLSDDGELSETTPQEIPVVRKNIPEQANAVWWDLRQFMRSRRFLGSLAVASGTALFSFSNKTGANSQILVAVALIIQFIFLVLFQFLSTSYERRTQHRMNIPQFLIPVLLLLCTPTIPYLLLRRLVNGDWNALTWEYLVMIPVLTLASYLYQRKVAARTGLDGKGKSGKN